MVHETWKKVLIGWAVALVLVIIVSITVYQSHKNLVTCKRQSPEAEPRFGGKRLGRVKPKTYVNIGAKCVRQDRKTSRPRKATGSRRVNCWRNWKTCSRRPMSTRCEHRYKPPKLTP